MLRPLSSLLLAFGLLVHSTECAFAQATTPETEKSHPSSLPQGVLALQWNTDAGYSPARLETEKDTYFSTNVIPSIFVGATDRVEVSLWDPGVALRFGERQSSEWIPFISSGVAAVGYSSLEGFLLELEPQLGLQLRHWLTGHTALYSHLIAATELSLRTKRFCTETTSNCKNFSLFEQMNFQLSLGAIFEAGRWSFAPSITVEPQWRTKEGWRSPIIHISESQHQALRRLPFLRYNFTKAFALGGSPYAGFRIDRSDWAVGGAISLLFTW